MSARRRHTALRIAAVLLLLLGACGDDAGQAPARPPPAPPRAPPPDLPPIPAEERAAYALECLLRGPKPLRGLRVPRIHMRNIELAAADLAGLEPQTLKLLDDAALIERVTEMALRPTRGEARPNTNPWDNVLYVLLAIDTKPTPLVLAWTRPALRIPVEATGLAPLRLQAVRVLASVDDPAVAPALFELLAADPGNREIGITALPPLLAYGPPWRARALDVIVRGGSAAIWAQAHTHLAGLTPPGHVDPSIAGALAWWAALVEGSGPPPPPRLPKRKSHQWAGARLGLDPEVPRAPSPDGRVQVAAYGPLPSSVTHGFGWNTTKLVDQVVFPLYAYVLGGKQPAAHARCQLARYGFEGYRQSVFADLADEASDPAGATRPRDEGLYYAALHCMLDADPGGERKKAVAQLRALLDTPAPPSRERAIALERQVRSLPPCVEPESWELLVRILRELRPLDVFRPVLESAYESMSLRETEQKLLLLELLEAGEEDPDSRGVALHFIRLTREPEFLPALERELERETEPGRTAALRRVLLFIYTRGYGIEPREYPAIVARVRRWMAEARPQDAGTLATALLDLGDPGVEAFAEGLRGEERPTYLAAWPRSRQLVQVGIAEALLDPVDASTPRDEVAFVLALAYHNFPAAGAPALAALRARVVPDYRPWVEATLERVRHRAPRHRDV